MGFFAALANAVIDVAPVLFDRVIEPAVQWGINAIKSMDGYSYSAIRSMDGETPDKLVSDEERRQEEVLVITPGELRQREIAEFVRKQTQAQKFILEMPIYGLQHTVVNLNLQKNFTFGPNPTDLDLSNINFKDHVAIQIVPSDFKEYSNLLAHDLFKIRAINIRSMTSSGYETSTFIGFIPETTNTKRIDNSLLLQMARRLKTDQTLDYNIRYVTPDIIDYDKSEDYTGQYKSTIPYIEANKVLKTSYIKGLEDNEALAYGTVIIIKQNVGATVGMSFSVTLTFDCYDYTIQGKNTMDLADTSYTKEPDDGNNSDGEDGDSGNGSKKPKIMKKKK